MADSYDIHLTDPLSTAFKVKAFTSNGTVFPTSSSLSNTAVGAATSLLIYGKGHPEYGERTSENILHVLENFSGSSAPENPISGQLWYVRFTVIRSGGLFYIWTDDSLDVNGGTWAPFFPGTGVRPAITDGAVSDGDYWLDGSDDLFLAIKDSSSHPLAETWFPRLFEDRDIGAPAVTDKPRKVLKIYTGESWQSSNAVHVSEVEPATPALGELWYDDGIISLEPQLKVYNGISFISVADRYLLLDGTSQMSGDLDMNSNLISNVNDPVGLQDAATRNYVDTAIGTLPTELTNLTDVTLTASSTDQVLRFNGALWVNADLLMSNISDVSASSTEINFLVGVTETLSNVHGDIDTLQSGKINISGDTMTGLLTLSSNPTNLLHAATKQYVDNAVTGLPDNVINSGSWNSTTFDLTLVPSLATGDVIVNITHAHDSTEVTHTSSLPYVRDLNPGSFPDVVLSDLTESTLQDLSGRLNKLDDFARRELFTAAAAQVNFPFTDGNYSMGSNRLTVFEDGVKKYASVRARQSLLFDKGKNLSITSLLGLADDDYDFKINVDAAGDTTIVVSVLLATSTIADVISAINAAFTSTGTANAIWNPIDTAIQVFSGTTGNGSSIEITNGGAGADPDLLASLSAVTPTADLPVYEDIAENIFPAFPSNVTQVTADLDYDEVLIVSSSGSQEVDVGGAKTGVDSSGLLNDATTYTATIAVDGGSAQPISIVGSASQTYQDVINEINLDLTDAVSALIGGNIVVTSFSGGPSSTISIVDTDLFSSLTGYVAINAAVPGADSFDPAVFGTTSTAITFNAGMTGGEVIEMTSL